MLDGELAALKEKYEIELSENARLLDSNKLNKRLTAEYEERIHVCVSGKRAISPHAWR